MTLITLPPTVEAPVREPRPPLVLVEPAKRLRDEAHDEGIAIQGEGRLPVIIGHVLLVLLGLVAIFPVFWMYLSSVRPPDQVLSDGLFSSHFSLANYQVVFQQLDAGRLVFNTTFMAVCVSAGQLLSGLFAAYAFARWKFRGSNVVFMLFIGTWLVPFQVTMLPNYVELSHLGILNSLPGVIVPQLASALSVLMLRQHLKAFPTDLLDAARVDGQSSFATLWRVVVPNMVPALSALAILLFVNQWNEYLWPFLVYRQPNSVIQIGIQSFLSTEGTNYGALMAASGLACLPIFILYVVLQRRVVNAFVRSGLR